MDFNEHLELKDKHAFLSASKYHWINYTDKKLKEAYENHKAIQIGTEIHELACSLIKHKQKMEHKKYTLNMYVNDAIKFNMKPEQVLYYSENCFGTADAISFRDDFLRIHDLKTGKTKASMKQLEIYTALFCLEYDQMPDTIKTELRIYQNNECIIHVPNPEDIKKIMYKIFEFDQMIKLMKG